MNSGLVARLQELLRGLGFRVDDQPGEVGRDTTFAIRAFQRMVRIDTDGIPGPQTLEACERTAREWQGIIAPLVLDVSHEPTAGRNSMALRLTPNLAITLRTGDRGRLRFLSSPFWAKPVPATDLVPAQKEVRELSLGRWVLALQLQATPDDRGIAPGTTDLGVLQSPSVGSRCKALNGVGEGFGVVSGTIVAVSQRDESEWLEIRGLSRPGDIPSGTPFFVDGRIAGLWHVPSHSALSVSELRRFVDTMTKSADAARDPRDEIFQDLGVEAVDALALAEGLRLAMGEDVVDMGQLLVALAHQPNGEMHRLLAAVGYSVKTLAQDLWGDDGIPDPTRHRVSLKGLPGLSENSWEALTTAARVAKAHASPHITPRHLLYGVLSIEKARVTQHLRSIGIKKEDVALGVPLAPNIASSKPAAKVASTSAWRVERPSVASDTVAGQRDLLGLDREVEVMGSVIAARDVEPPVSIGLFGDWGTGKTFFMKQVESWISRMTSQARKAASDPSAAPSAYCTNIVQLWFNAWHYIDANLWASLTAEIFEGLGEALRVDSRLTDGVDDPEQARARLLTAASSARDVLAEAERRKSDAEADGRAIQQSLESLRLSEVAIARSLVSAAVDVAREQPEVKEKLEAAGKALGGSAARAATRELQSQVKEIAGFVGSLRAIWIAMGQRPRLTAALVAVGAVLGLGLAFVRPPAFLGAMTARVAGAIVFLSTMIGPYLPRIARAKKLIGETLARHQETLRSAEEKRKHELEQRQAEVRQQMAVAERRLEEARAAVQDLDKKLSALRADAHLSEFIAERRESTDYTQHLGVVARARRDFERLSDLLRQGNSQSSEASERTGTATLPKIDRIILYIDDLDRCPEDKVVEVLQAVHLLLAFPLFIVVVGVDSRWLLHSLKQRAGIFRDSDVPDDGMSDEERVHWRSTPLNYLEKIFQIPFSLRPMERDGFDRLIEDLAPAVGETWPASNTGFESSTSRIPLVDAARATAVGPASHPAANSAASLPEGRPVTPQGDAQARIRAPFAMGGGSTGKGEAAPALEGPSGATDDEAPIDLNPAHLKISADEQALMKEVFPFIPSPRAAKRFVNVYRLLRATVDREDWSRFLGADGTGDHRAVILLLAMLIGYPSEGTEILRDLVENPPKCSWWEAVVGYRDRGRLAPDLSTPLATGGAKATTPSEEGEFLRWRELLTKLGKMRQGQVIREREPCTVFSVWALRVARYSFESGRITMARGASPAVADRMESTDAAAPVSQGTAEPCP